MPCIDVSSSLFPDNVLRKKSASKVYCCSAYRCKHHLWFFWHIPHHFVSISSLSEKTKNDVPKCPCAFPGSALSVVSFFTQGYTCTHTSLNLHTPVHTYAHSISIFLLRTVNLQRYIQFQSSIIGFILLFCISVFSSPFPSRSKLSLMIFKNVVISPNIFKTKRSFSISNLNNCENHTS